MGAATGMAPFDFGLGGMGYGAVGMLTLAKSGCAGKIIAAVVDVGVVFEALYNIMLEATVTLTVVGSGYGGLGISVVVDATSVALNAEISNALQIPL